MSNLLHWLGWGTAFVPTDFANPIEGGNLWVYAKVRPCWYWFLRRMSLFLGIVWRNPCGEGGRPMDARTAWDVSRVAVGLSKGPVLP